MLLILILVAKGGSDGAFFAGCKDSAANGMEALVPHGRDRFPLLVREAWVLGKQLLALMGHSHVK